MASLNENETESKLSATPERENNLDKHVAQSFVVGNETDANLQDAFMKYKQQRQKELKKVRRKRKEIPDEARIRAMADPDRMWNLRMKFVEQAKKYFGVPYGKKYWKPEDPEYQSKMFLDCCGLVRRVMNDLKKDFGFKLGPWNQAYMCDTLPILVEKEEDMKPGDLVFISATYYNTKMKKQKHNMTHVEIWLGDGPKTIGSRWHKGKVQVFDSYRFNATSYHSETYIFKSIDTWLMGICRSHCRIHDWKTRAEKFKPTKKSIFRVPLEYDQAIKDNNLEEEAEESAGDSSGNDTAAETPGEDKEVRENQKSSRSPPKTPGKKVKKVSRKKKLRKKDVIEKACQERLERLSIHGKSFGSDPKRGEAQLSVQQPDPGQKDDQQETTANAAVESEDSEQSETGSETTRKDQAWRELFVFDGSPVRVPVIDSRESSRADELQEREGTPTSENFNGVGRTASWDSFHTSSGDSRPTTAQESSTQNSAGGAATMAESEEEIVSPEAERVPISEGVYYLRQRKP